MTLSGIFTHFFYIGSILLMYVSLTHCSLETTKKDLIEVDKVVENGINMIDDIEKIESDNKVP